MKGAYRSCSIPGRVSWALVFVFFFASCASGPRSRGPEFPSEANIFSVLPGGASLYIYADVERARPILDLLEFGGMSGASGAAMLDRTSTAVAAVYPGEGGRSYMVWGSGKYPSLRSSISFTFSRAWKKQKSETGHSYWRNRDAGLSVLIKSGYALVSDGDPFFTGPVLEPSPRWAALKDSALLSGAAEKAGERINAFLNSLGLPIQFPAETLIFGLYPADGAQDGAIPGKTGEEPGPLYRGLFYIETPSASLARSVLSMLSLARRFFQNSGVTGDTSLAVMSALFANQGRLEGSAAVIETGPMNAEEIALLFNMFSVY